jgi:2-(1,2-epoxy-1,2-dihydrophenyl)acetyl-CoA isomerase
MAPEQLVLSHRVGDVCVVTMNDPATMNAASTQMVEQLISAFTIAAKSARAIVLTGVGRGFCSGANLGVIPDPTLPDYDAGLLLETHYNRLLMAVRDLPLPIVTAINGAAAGLGSSLGLAGDLIVAARSSYFKQAFDRIGLVPDAASAYLLIRSVGRPRAMELLFLGEEISACQALDWGMVNRVVDDDVLMETALEIAARLAAGPTAALRMTRQLAWKSMDMGFAESLDVERELQKLAGRTGDHREGLAAFFEKRRPRFRGE